MIHEKEVVVFELLWFRFLRRLCFQFGMWIGNEATVSGVPFVWYDINTSSSMQGSQPCIGQWMGGMLTWCSTSSVRESW